MSIHLIMSREKRGQKDEGRTLRNDVQHDVDDSICMSFIVLDVVLHKFFMKVGEGRKESTLDHCYWAFPFCCYVFLTYDNFQHQNELKTKESPTQSGSGAPQVCQTTTADRTHTKRNKVTTMCHK